MSKLLFAGSRLDAFTATYGGPADVTFGIDTDYSDAGVNVRNGGVKGFLYDPAAAPLLSPYSVEEGASFYFHAYLNQSGNAATITLLDNAGAQWVQLNNNGQLQYNSGTASDVVWTNIGVAYGVAPSNQDIDLKVDLSSTGVHTVTLLYNQTIVSGPVTFNQPLLTNIAQFELTSQGDGYQDVVWSQVLCTENISTVGGHVATSRATGAGTYSQWSGSYTDVNAPVTTNTTYNQATSAGLQQSYPMGNITVPAGSYIEGVFYWLIAKNDGTEPENIASLIRTAANVDHVSGNLDGINIGFNSLGARYDVNPDTGAQWTQTDWNAPVQLGFVSEE